jgi:Protein of unknown function (DUF3187)
MMRFAAVLAGALLLTSQSGLVWAEDGGYFGLLRARDLTSFGFLRLDMRPAHAVSAPAGNWAIETELGYQNTWALSPEVEQYLSALPGRRELGPTELQAIRDLPGENYLVDLELAELDVTFHYKFAQHWGAYLIVSGVSYNGGFLDSTIEQFHETFGFSTFGRKAVSRNDVNLILDLKSAQVAEFEAPISGGLLDPTVGVRHSGFELFKGWDLVLEGAIKVPIQGRRAFLSTGHADYGLEATLQHFAAHHAYYVSMSGVYYDGTTSVTPTAAQVVPTLVLGYEHRFTPDTHLILQGYISPSIYSEEDTDLDELRSTKYQLSLGFYHRMGGSVLSFGITENLQNVDNTPDIGFQLGWAYSPALKRGL